LLAPDLVAPTSLHRNVAEEVVHAIKWAVSRRYMPMEKVTAMCNDPEAATMIAAK
jgi:hypothetical protein